MEEEFGSKVGGEICLVREGEEAVFGDGGGRDGRKVWDGWRPKICWEMQPLACLLCDQGSDCCSGCAGGEASVAGARSCGAAKARCRRWWVVLVGRARTSLLKQ